MAFFTSRADLNVGIVNEYILNSSGTIQGQGQQVINFFNPTVSLPVAPADGDRYISTTTANGWIINNIELYSASTGLWKNISPIAGTILWITALPAPSVRMWNPTTVAWENPVASMGGVIAVPSTNQALVRFSGVAGQVQNSGVTLDNLNNITGIQNANIAGNVYVGGTITATTTHNLIVSDRFITLNNGYTTAAGQSAGLVMNYLPTGIATTSIAPGFTPAVPATSDATIQTAAAGPLWVVGDIVMVSNSISNDGMYEVQSHAANVLTLKSTGLNATTIDFVQDQIVTEATVGVDITGVSVTEFRTSTTGVLQYATGTSAATLVYKPLTAVTTEIYTTPGTTVHDVPSNVQAVRVTMWGGGGSGGGSTAGGGGGGGSSHAIMNFEHQVSPSVGTMTVTVGDGGLGAVGDNSVLTYTGTNPFTITSYGGGRGSNSALTGAGGGGGGGPASQGQTGITFSTGFGGNFSTTYPIQGPSGAPGGDDEVTGGGVSQPGGQGQIQGFSVSGSGGGGGGLASGAIGGAGLGGAGGTAPGRGGGGAGGPGGPGANGAPNVASTAGSTAAANTGAGGGGGSISAIGGNGGSGKIILEYF